MAVDNPDDISTDLSIIIPLLNEAEQMPELLQHLHDWRCRGAEIIVVDGGSSDHSDEMAESENFTVLRSKPGRAQQMNAGARLARGNVLLFLHADTRLPEGADQLVMESLNSGEYCWGRFDVRISGQAPMLGVVAGMMNLRSRLTGIATGDQSIFVDRLTFLDLGGYADQPLMEDIEISQRLKNLSPPITLRQRVTTSGRRWLDKGIWRTIWLMWRLRWAYWRGVPATKLVEEYR